jgi:hypothetical protein
MIVLPFRIMPVTENIASTGTHDAFAVRYMRASGASGPNLVKPPKISAPMGISSLNENVE